MKRTWIDLTDIIEWSGQHGGTQRVVYGIAEQYYLQSLKKSQSVGYFIFKSTEKRFYEVDFKTLRDRVIQSRQQAGTVKQNEGITRKEKLKHYVVEYTPGFIRSNEKMKKNIHLVAKTGYRALRSGKHTLRDFSKRNQKVAIGKLVKFNSSDVVLILGKPWDEPELTPLLADLRSRIGFKLGVVIYDLVIPLYPHLHSPRLFKSYTQYMFEIAAAADILFPISKSTEKDLFKFCDTLSISKPKTEVIRLADEIEGVAEPKKPAALLHKEYLLCVGTIEVRKNHMLLYYVYKLAHERGIVLPQLVIVGRPGWLADDAYNIIRKDKEVAKSIKIIKNANDSELAWLYENCLFTVYPSMYEGWGLPVAEAMQYGKVAVASSSSSITEIAGDLLKYFSPYSVDDCLALIVNFLDSDTRVTTENAIKSNYSSTSWKLTATSIARHL